MLDGLTLDKDSLNEQSCSKYIKNKIKLNDSYK
jgi:hypothetical protein